MQLTWIVQIGNKWHDWNHKDRHPEAHVMKAGVEESAHVSQAVKELEGHTVVACMQALYRALWAVLSCEGGVDDKAHPAVLIGPRTCALSWLLRDPIIPPLPFFLLGTSGPHQHLLLIFQSHAYRLLDSTPVSQGNAYSICSSRRSIKHFTIHTNSIALPEKTNVVSKG